MSTNKYDLKSLIDSSNLSKENDDKPMPISANQSESDLSDDKLLSSSYANKKSLQ